MCSAIGYENEDGTVNYVITAETSLDELLVKYISKRTVPTSGAAHRKTVDDYFSPRDEEGVCQIHWLILYKLDNTAVCKKPGTAGVFVYMS